MKTLALVFIVRIPAWVYLGVWFLYQFLEARYALLTPEEGGSGVAFAAHVGGFLFGVLAACALVGRDPGSGGVAAISAFAVLIEAAARADPVAPVRGRRAEV